MRRHIVVTRGMIFRVSLQLFILFGVVSIISLLVGKVSIDVSRGLESLLFGWCEGSSLLSPSEKTIIFTIRLQRVLFAGIVGAALSVAGVIFQGLLRNSLAEPFVLGISGGAAVGAIIGIVAGLGSLSFGIPALAFSGAALTVFLVFVIGRSGGRFDSNVMLLAGVIVNAFFSATIMFFISISSNADLHGITFWLMGNLGLVNGMQLIVTAAVVCAGSAWIWCYGRALNLIATGEETALQLGVEVQKTKIVLFIAASFITAAAVSFAGIIGFVGLMIPHMMRMLLGSDNRILIPASFLFGASFLVAADTVARTIVPHAELPVGVITASCGAPYFIYLLRRKVR